MAFLTSILFFAIITTIAITLENSYAIQWYIDVLSLLVVLPPALWFARAATSKQAWRLGWQWMFRSQISASAFEFKEVCRYLQVCGNLCVMLGLFYTMVGWILIGQSMDDEGLYDLSPAFALSLLTLFYGFGFKICFYVAEQRVRSLYLRHREQSNKKV